VRTHVRIRLPRGVTSASLGLRGDATALTARNVACRLGGQRAPRCQKRADGERGRKDEDGEQLQQDQRGLHQRDDGEHGEEDRQRDDEQKRAHAVEAYPSEGGQMSLNTPALGRFPSRGGTRPRPPVQQGLAPTEKGISRRCARARF
jgi:hypothetical protein